MPDRHERPKDAIDLAPNGILEETGRPFQYIDESANEALGATVAADEHVLEVNSAGEARYGAETTFGSIMEVNPEKLDETGWDIVFPVDVDATQLKEALAPLLKLRAEQVGDGRFEVFDGSRGVRPGESVLDWLERQGPDGQGGPGLGLVNPRKGVPFYLLLVASPEQIPMTFQYMLDLYWAVGRLHFDSVAEYERYAQSVARYESLDYRPQQRRQATMFATEHSFDPATQMFTRHVARPFIDGGDGEEPVHQGLRFALDPILGGGATKAALADALCGRRAGGPPAVLFSGGHGMVFRATDPRLPACQGALVCNDWEGYGAINERHWFAAEDVPDDARVHGMLHFLFACYGGGWEKYDTFRDGPDGTSRQVAPAPGLARLPQRLLAHPNGGALAVLAHVDRAWSYSFQTLHKASQNTGLREVLRCLLNGLRVGNATDRFNLQWAALSAPLSDAMRTAGANPTPAALREVARLWIARDDARNYVIIGDPAVRLRLEDMLPAG